MTTFTELYPLLKKAGLDDSDVQPFIGVIEGSMLNSLATQEDLKATETRLREKLIGYKNFYKVRFGDYRVGFYINQILSKHDIFDINSNKESLFSLSHFTTR